MSEERHVRAGDVYLVDLAPTRGSEQSGVRPVLVISADELHRKSRRMIVCPITSNMAPWTTKVPLPTACRTKGMVLTDQIRAVDIKARILRHIETLPPDFVMTVRSYVGRLLELEVRPS
nr:type II toxin-antitoxin system PemK/MazF family toxin [Mesorhizobium sp.]